MELVVAEAENVPVFGRRQDVFLDPPLCRLAGFGGGDEFDRGVVDPLAQLGVGTFEVRQ
ncbi:hypothetical protein D3C87_2199550 [compost metagenome]